MTLWRFGYRSEFNFLARDPHRVSSEQAGRVGELSANFRLGDPFASGLEEPIRFQLPGAGGA
jgi:hypothetical protein